MKAGGRVHIDLLRWARLDYSLSGLPRGLKSVSKAFGLNPVELSFDGKDLLDYSIEEIEEYVLSDVDCTKYMFEHYFPQIEYTAEILSDYFSNDMNIIICGGGRKNKFLVNKIEKKINKKLKLIDHFGIDADFIESQAFAYLAIRSYLNLPISFPETTGVTVPSTGGIIIKY